MPKRKRVVLDPEEFNAFLEEGPADAEAALKRIKIKVQEYIDAKSSSSPALLPVSSLSLSEVMTIFGLQSLNRDLASQLWDEYPVYSIPEYLYQAISRTQWVINNPSSKSNEAYCRTIIDQILIGAMYEESHHRSQSLGHDTISEEDPAILQLQLETTLQLEVTYRHEKRLLSGVADYTVWYESVEKDRLATNLVIIEAKRQHDTDMALSQLAAYMSIVHTSRKQAVRQNSTIFGVASDGAGFRFCRIDNNSTWAISTLLEWDITQHREKIFSIFRELIRTAALSSPSTTPIKDPMKRQNVLAAFGSPVHSRKFNFNTSKMSFQEFDEETMEMAKLRR